MHNRKKVNNGEQYMFVCADTLCRSQHQDVFLSSRVEPVHILRRGHRGSYMSAHVLLNLLNEFGKRGKMRGLPSILSLFSQRV